ncbi:hypothetical protein EDM00_11210 [Ornithobacterium rhinotracheale]|uniref:hypothetical protein n=1 Tax=Ornithobacterium rhinotracheale TaxID=28251 RepID=UPI00129D0835|nr:hypothetical protein [Ornithobacterium rhinotracheale]MRI64548.1 hypothetical protein [Ornithobacterium rhinotracheale]
MGEKNAFFCNIPEEKTRAARWLVLLDKSVLTYNQNYNGRFPAIENYLLKVRINTDHTIKRAVSYKEKNFNRYHDIKIVSQFYPIASNEIVEIRRFVKKNAYIGVLITNDDFQVLGNSSEPMSFRIDDKIKDNASGNDYYELIIEGKTTVYPTINKLPEDKIKKQLFKVLLFGNPMR